MLLVLDQDKREINICNLYVSIIPHKVLSLIHNCVFCPWRFHSPAKEPALNYDVVLPVDDDVQLSVVQYRNKLYEVQNESEMFRGLLHCKYYNFFKNLFFLSFTCR